MGIGSGKPLHVAGQSGHWSASYADHNIGMYSPDNLWVAGTIHSSGTRGTNRKPTWPLRCMLYLSVITRTTARNEIGLASRRDVYYVDSCEDRKLFRR